jgi:glycosyltransferase involved in cell wall biosynthesis
MERRAEHDRHCRASMRDPVIHRIAAVIPALDEAEALPGVLAALPRAGAGWTLARVIVADNGSRDRTAAVARSRGAEVVEQPRRGYGAACLAGLAVLAADPPDVVVFMDGDGSDDPAGLPHVVAPIVEDRADLVVGSRVLGGYEPGSLTPVQRFGNALAGRLLGVLFGARCTDLGPFRAMRWSALMELRMRDQDYGWTVEMQARAARAGWRALEVPVRWRRRAAGRSKVSGTLRGVVGAGWKILFTLARVRLGG